MLAFILLHQCWEILFHLYAIKNLQLLPLLFLRVRIIAFIIAFIAFIISTCVDVYN